jgi:hypothetical protein
MATVNPAQMNQFVSAVDRLEQTMKNKREMYIDWDGHDKRVETIVANGMKKTIRIVNDRKRI